VWAWSTFPWVRLFFFSHQHKNGLEQALTKLFEVIHVLQASDAAHDTKVASKKTGKSIVENVKGGAHKVGRALHIVADSTESEFVVVREVNF